jgi:HD-GYP domain-containing protein (c-di-GMP phosphodiesterase class II)
LAEVSAPIGRELALPDQAPRVLARVGLLHEIGKIRIPDAVLLELGLLDDDV